ncbi:hypothetical protein GPALN_004577 [Globodera pallida]|uniref:ShK domain-containing protein n=1 Tax=Globodera pallida TaxID=36090 RepID=A0A183BX95_GLOPA|nr:hypothetical protein GPALN_004577 [Globodera pallida]
MPSKLLIHGLTDVFIKFSVCTACTATLVFNRNQGGIAAPTKSACPTLACPGGNSAEYLPRGSAAFDVQQNNMCASPCICDTSNVCYQPSGVSNGNILVRLTTQCPATCASSDGCTIQALVDGTSPRTTGCLALQGTTTCRYRIDDTFNAKYVSCNGCPNMNTLTCGGQVP